ncbi:alginate export family protein [Puniceicoccaceae bacterium K14]|nr:alginate export family protein [Puniceicoccaceae bacterium K14]
MIKLLSRNASVLAAAGIAATTSGVANADAIEDLIDGFIAEGKVSLNARARYEYNDTSGPGNVDGYSLRTRLGYTTGAYKGFKAMVEMEDISFNNPDDRPGLDVPATELNQAWLSYANDSFTGKLGRQVYVFDDQRFIGHVGWRQNIQTFDALSTSFNVGDAKVSLGYLDAVHRITAGSEDLSGLLANGAFSISPELNVTAFIYSLDFDNRAAWSSDTYGVRATGKFGGEDVTYNYAVSYAKQGDNSGSATDFSTDYYAGEFSVKTGGVTGALGLEVLGSDEGRGFTTPLATVHKFSGFADVFAANSIGGSLTHGLEDLYAKVAFKAGPVPITLFYHKFSTDEGGIDLGTEIDAVFAYKVNKYVSLLAKYAYYESDYDAPDLVEDPDALVIGYGTGDKTVFTFEANIAF